MKYADVILPMALPINFTYSIPPELEADILPGCRVAVQFGKSKKYAAIVKAIHGTAPKTYKTKPLLYLLDQEPVVHQAQLEFWSWLADYYMCTEGDVMHAALPAHLKLTSETRLVFNPGYGDDFSQLTDDEFLVAEALQVRKELRIDEVQKILDKIEIYKVVRRLLEKRICYVYEELKDAFTPKREIFVTLHPRCEDEGVLAQVFEEIQRAPRQLETLLAFLHLKKTGGRVLKKSVQEKAGVSASVVNALADKNVLVIKSEITDRIPFSGAEPESRFVLDEFQQKGLDEIKALFAEKQVVLLHGVTSSGKTMLYIRLIEEYLAKGKQVLYLLPEIALTAQIVKRLQKHFGEQIGIYHSRFSNNERVEIWNKVKTGEYKVVLGARSALLLPFQSLGFVVLDEEHDASYKQQDPAPRYHARDAAIYYATLFGAKVLLGSATPSLESYYNARTGKYGLVTLTSRFGGLKMPDIRIVDMKQVQKSRKSPTPYLSPALQETMKETLGEEKQIILFQNRRGYAPVVICAVCGWTPQCNNCDVSLTYHKYQHKLLCHYCGHKYPPPEVCPACGNTKLVNKSFGTERIEDDLAPLFPKVRIARMDLDSIRRKDAHHKLIELFEQKRIDILVGTQMVVKGLDFDHVKLVGILSADNLLSYPDFRVHERAFQLMEQVSGRSGRKETRGIVVIQAVNTKHPVLQFVLDHDYTGFYEKELAERERFAYPPFTRLIRLVLKHRREEVVREAAALLGKELSPLFGDQLLGPAPPPVGRVRNFYLMEFLLKTSRGSTGVAAAKQAIKDKLNWLQAQAKFRRVYVVSDVDCV